MPFLAFYSLLFGSLSWWNLLFRARSTHVFSTMESKLLLCQLLAWIARNSSLFRRSLFILWEPQPVLYFWSNENTFKQQLPQTSELIKFMVHGTRVTTHWESLSWVIGSCFDRNTVGVLFKNNKKNTQTINGSLQYLNCCTFIFYIFL